jgi:hypothetical protein
MIGHAGIQTFQGFMTDKNAEIPSAYGRLHDLVKLQHVVLPFYGITGRIGYCNVELKRNI